MTDSIRVSLKRGLATIALLVSGVLGASAQGNNVIRPFVAGRVIVTLNPARGTVADVTAAATSINAVVERAMLTPNMYILRIPTAKADAAGDALVTGAVTTLKANPKFSWVGPDRLMKWTDTTPNDPLFQRQWHLPLMNVTKGWDIQKGSGNVVAVVIDSGTQVDHPDLIANFLGGQNFGDPANPTVLTDNVPHGTHVHGIIGATTNNAVGVSGIIFANSKVFFAKIADPATNAPLYSAAVDAITYVRTKIHKGGVQVVMNMSFGNEQTGDDPDATDPLAVAIVAAAKEGIVSCIAAGNSFDAGNPGFFPANCAQLHQNIICVAACGPQKEHSFFSEARPYTTISAPGGDDPTFANPSAQILSTLPVTLGGPYGTEQGTSMASPACAGCVALLLSAGADPFQIKNIITTTADNGGRSVPNPEFGFGVIDVNAALLSLNSVKISVGTGPNDPIETLQPPIKVTVRQVLPANVEITVDGTTIPQRTSTSTGPSWQIANIVATQADSTGALIPFSYDALINVPSTPPVAADISAALTLSPGRHTVVATGTQPGPPVKVLTDTLSFTITPHVIPGGRSMASIPYYQFVDLSGNVAFDAHDPSLPNQITPQIYFGTNFRLARWLPDQERYVYYSSFGQADNGASFTPVDEITRLDGDPATAAFAKWPLGIGYWVDTESAKPILTKGQPLTDKAFIIPLKGNGSGSTNFISWNMIGDPFPFDVPFNALLVDTPAGRLSIQQAADAGYILPNVYSFDGTNGYTFRTLPDGAVSAWQAHWIGVTSKTDISLVLPPAKLTRLASPSSRAAAAPTTTSSSAWKLQIGAHVRNLNDAYNFIGVASKAQDAYDRSDVPKPPMVGPYVSLGVSNTDWGAKSGLYAQDIRSIGPSKTWNISVDSDQLKSDVTINWNTASLPHNVRLTLKDVSNGQTYDMRSRAAITFNTGSQITTRKFTITATQSVGNALRIANLSVRSTSRGSMASVIGFNLTGDATYEVKVLNASGSSISTIGSRAASASGDVSLIWNGRDNQGRAVAAGTYLVQVRATTTDGQAVKAIQPFTVVR